MFIKQRYDSWQWWTWEGVFRHLVLCGTIVYFWQYGIMVRARRKNKMLAAVEKIAFASDQPHTHKYSKWHKEELNHSYVWPLSASSHKHRPAQSVPIESVEDIWPRVHWGQSNIFNTVPRSPSSLYHHLSCAVMRCPAISAIPATWGQRQSKGRQPLTLRVDSILITQVHDSPQGHWENMQPHNCQDSQPWPQHRIQVDDRTWNIQFSKSKKILMLHFIQRDYVLTCSAK